MNYYFEYDFEIGKLTIVESNEKIIGITLKNIKDGSKFETPLIKKTKTQLNEYFKGVRENFDLPFSLKGTSFQKAVWSELLKIAYGKTLTYKNIAEKIKNPNSQRAVGQACNKNPVLILIPCHRVIGSNFSLKGFAAGIEVKKRLLNLENINCNLKY